MCGRLDPKTGENKRNCIYTGLIHLPDLFLLLQSVLFPTLITISCLLPPRTLVSFFYVILPRDREHRKVESREWYKVRVDAGNCFSIGTQDYYGLLSLFKGSGQGLERDQCGRKDWNCWKRVGTNIGSWYFSVNSTPVRWCNQYRRRQSI